MIVWNGQEMHDAIHRYLSGVRRPQVDENERCVNEGAEGCTVVAGETGWCGPCWTGVVGVQ